MRQISNNPESIPFKGVIVSTAVQSLLTFTKTKILKLYEVKLKA